MSTALISVLIALFGLILATLTYFAGVKKTSNADIEKRAYFEGEITAKLDQLIKRFDSLEAKLSKNTGELHAEIDKKIQDHEKRYHHGTRT